MEAEHESYTFTVGKLDAGMAILLGERAHLIEFPSILLPPGATAGSIVNIAVHQNVAAEHRRDRDFWALQDSILENFGKDEPQPPKLEIRHTTQTSVTLQWAPLQLAAASLRSLDLYRNGVRLTAIANPRSTTVTKISALDVGADYAFQLVLRTSAGTRVSEVVRVRTHNMRETTGIKVCFGTVEDSAQLQSAKDALREMGAQWNDKIEIDTTHFVCTTPNATPAATAVVANTGTGAGTPTGAATGPGAEYQRALQLSIPVVQPQWVQACLTEKRMIPIANFYLGKPVAAFSASSKTPTPTQSQTQVAGQTQRPQSMQAQSSSSNVSTVARNTNGASRQSMPAVSPRSQSPSQARSPPPRQSPPASAPASSEAQGFKDTSPPARSPTPESRHKGRSGTMDRNFKFPPPSPLVMDKRAEEPGEEVEEQGEEVNVQSPPPPPVPAHDEPRRAPAGLGFSVAEEPEEVSLAAVAVSGGASGIARPGVEVPPPPPVEKEQARTVVVDDQEEEVGETEEIALN